MTVVDSAVEGELILAVSSAVSPAWRWGCGSAARSLSTRSASPESSPRLGFDPAQRVEHGRVIAAAVEPADLGKREVGQLAGQEDRDLARPQRGGGAAGADQLGAGDAEGGGDLLLDLLDRRRLARRRRRGSPRRSARSSSGRGRQRGVGDDPGQGAVELADVGVDPAGQLGRARRGRRSRGRPRGPGGAGRSAGSRGWAARPATVRPHSKRSRSRSASVESCARGCGRRRARSGSRPHRAR